MSRILIVEDEILPRQALRLLLESEGHLVEEARDGIDIEQTVREWNPDLVITDIVMPRREGVETIKALREDFPNLKILAVSGSGGARADFLRLAQRFGANATLEKPFEGEALLAKIKPLLARAESQPGG